MRWGSSSLGVSRSICFKKRSHSTWVWDSSVRDIILGLGAAVTLLQRKGTLCAFQCLALTLHVATEHQSPLGRIQIKPDNVPEFLLKVRIIGDLKSLQPMWLYFIRSSDNLVGS